MSEEMAISRETHKRERMNAHSSWTHTRTLAHVRTSAHTSAHTNTYTNTHEHMETRRCAVPAKTIALPRSLRELVLTGAWLNLSGRLMHIAVGFSCSAD